METFFTEFCQMKTFRTVHIVLTKAGLLPTSEFYKFNVFCSVEMLKKKFLKSLKYYFAIFTDFTKIK